MEEHTTAGHSTGTTLTGIQCESSRAPFADTFWGSIDRPLPQVLVDQRTAVGHGKGTALLDWVGKPRTSFADTLSISTSLHFTASAMIAFLLYHINVT